MTEYLVIKKETFTKKCFSCDGAGSKTTRQSGHNFKKTCAYCGGKGYTTGYHTTEIPLVDVLKQLKLL